jgi:hypothetical protein
MREKFQNNERGRGVRNGPKIGRRRFLKLALATGACAVPAAMGYGFVHGAKGDLPPSVSPYAPVDVMESWPSRLEAASPILVLINGRADNPFGLYLAEILRAEGLNCFQIGRASDLGNAPLDWYDLVLLAEGALGDTQVKLLEGYVAQGGRLVAMRPDARLASLLGVERMGGSTMEGYLQVEGSHPIGQGISAETLQFHGTADHYRLAGAQVVAWLASDADTRTDFPALAVYRHQRGQAALWAFDLASSVAYTRQGNPAWADQERDGLDGIRAIDMYKGWVDLDRLLIPQADEQQRLLANLLSALTQDLRPLPRLWYFAGAAPTMLIATGDSHQNPAYVVEDVLTRVEQRGGHMSVYYAPPVVGDWHRASRKAKRWAEDLPLVGEAIAGDSTPPGPSDIANWRARGHEFAIHPYVADGASEEGLEAGWRRYWKEFTGLGYGPVPPTVRTHRILWTGWVETARMQATFGMRLNLDAYHVGPSLRKESGEWIYGHFTGSGLPMRFVDEQGRILNIYQQLTQLVDEHLLERLVPSGDWPRLDAEAALEVSRTILDHSLAGAYSAIVSQFHPDRFIAGYELGPASARWLEGTLDYAVAKGVPIWSALEWLRFTEVRHDADLADVQWHSAGKHLGFRLVAEAAPEVELTVMVPLQHGDATLVQVEIDGVVEKYGERAVGGVSYAWVPVEAGPHRVVATYGGRAVADGAVRSESTELLRTGRRTQSARRSI